MTKKNNSSAVRLRSLMLFSAALTVCTVSSTVYGQVEMGQWNSLFNGNDLRGWDIVGDGNWQAVSGELICAGIENEQRGWIVYRERIEDFKLRLKYKIAEGGDSGLFFRVPEQCLRSAEPDGYQVQILSDERSLNTSGAIYNVMRSYNGLEKAGQWNDLYVSVIGDHITVLLNDSVAVSFHDRKYLGGFLGLEAPSHKATVQFKEIELLSVPATRPLKPTLEERMNRAPGEWKSLHNGVDLRGWHVIEAAHCHIAADPSNLNREQHWGVQDGKIVGKFKSDNYFGWIVSTEEFENFILKIKWRLPQGGNSGVAIRYPFPVTFKESLRDPAFTGFESQIWIQTPHSVRFQTPLAEPSDTTSPELKCASCHSDNRVFEPGVLTPHNAPAGQIIRNPNGCFYDVANSWPNIARDHDWNEYEIYAYGQHLICYLNGVKASEIDYPLPGRSKKGSVAMQITSGGALETVTTFIPEGTVEFKDIRIKVIED